MFALMELGALLISVLMCWVSPSICCEVEVSGDIFFLLDFYLGIPFSVTFISLVPLTHTSVSCGPSRMLFGSNH